MYKKFKKWDLYGFGLFGDFDLDFFFDSDFLLYLLLSDSDDDKVLFELCKYGLIIFVRMCFKIVVDWISEEECVLLIFFVLIDILVYLIFVGFFCCYVDIYSGFVVFEKLIEEGVIDLCGFGDGIILFLI